MLRIDKSTKSKLWLSLYVFIFVFDPPFIPIDPVYLVGLLTMGYVLTNKNYRGKWPADLRKYNKFIIGLLFYFLVISTIDVIMGPANLLGNRIRCINASFVLTTFEIYCVIFVLKTSERKNLSLDDIYDIVLWAGLLQALCALVAFLHPDIRNIFLKFASADMYSNEYFLERRGYGFATNLVDTYGYAIGLIAGIRMILGDKGVLKNLICVALLVFCTFVNSRTGLAVIIIGFIFSIFRSNNAANSLAKILVGGIVAGIAILCSIF